jgi:hypothetical protein
MKSFKQFVVETVFELSVTDFPAILNTPTGQQLVNNPRSSVSRFLALANAAIQKGSLLKSQLEDLKSYAGSFVEFAFKGLAEKYRHNGQWETLPAELQHLDFQPNHSGLVTSTLQKALKLKVDHPYKTEAITILTELQKVENALAYLKTKIVTKQSKAEMVAQAAFHAPQATKDAQALVRRVLMVMTNEVKEQYIQQLEGPWIESLTDFFSKEHLDQLKDLKLDPQSDAERNERNKQALDAHKQRTGRSWGFQEEQRQPTYVEMLLPFAAQRSSFQSDKYYTDPMYGKPVWTPYPDWKHRIHLKAVQQAEDMQASFVAKNIRKLAAIVEAKGNIAGDPHVINVHCLHGIIEGNIRFSFTDGSVFVVRNKIVSKIYQTAGGQWATMYQYPTTFHDAILPGGKRMVGQPSEEQMNTIFAKS